MLAFVENKIGKSNREYFTCCRFVRPQTHNEGPVGSQSYRVPRLETETDPSGLGTGQLRTSYWPLIGPFLIRSLSSTNHEQARPVHLSVTALGLVQCRNITCISGPTCVCSSDKKTIIQYIFISI